MSHVIEVLTGAMWPILAILSVIAIVIQRRRNKIVSDYEVPIEEQRTEYVFPPDKAGEPGLEDMGDEARPR